MKDPHAPEGAERKPALPPPQTENPRVTFCCHSPRSRQQLQMPPCTTTGTRQELSLDNTEIECLLFPFHMRKSQCPRNSHTCPHLLPLNLGLPRQLPWAEGHGFSHTGCFFSDTLSGLWLFLQHAICLTPSPATALPPHTLPSPHIAFSTEINSSSLWASGTSTCPSPVQASAQTVSLFIRRINVPGPSAAIPLPFLTSPASAPRGVGIPFSQPSPPP